MKQFILVNDVERRNFEKRNQLPFGYSRGCIIVDSLDKALSLLFMLPKSKQEEYVIEMASAGNIEVVYSPSYRDGSETN